MCQHVNSGASSTLWHALRFSSKAYIDPAISALLTSDSMLRSLCSSSSFFWPVSLQTVCSCTPLISQSGVHCHLWWDKKATKFRFSCAMTDTNCPMTEVPLAFLPLGFLTTLQLSSTFLSVSTCNGSRLLRPCSWTNILGCFGAKY